VTGAFAFELPELFEVLYRDRELAQIFVFAINRLDPCQVEQSIQQRRGVARREDEPVAVRPDRIFGVKPQIILPERVNDGRHGHWRAWMAGVRLLDGVHAKGPDGVNRDRTDFRHMSEVFSG
jgi:hypothetical protein